MALGNLLATIAVRAEKVKVFFGVSQAFRKNRNKLVHDIKQYIKIANKIQL